MTTDKIPNDNETRLRMRKRFQEIDEQKKKMETAGSAWVMVFYIGFLITFIGAFLMLTYLGIIPLVLEVLIFTGIILFGTFVMAIAFFIKGSPTLIIDEM